jgi:poly(A) polymerase
MLKRIRDLLTRRGKQPAGQALPSTSGESPPAGREPPQVHQGPRVVHQPIPRSDLDSDAVKIINRLARFDHGAYLVGGCVRDLLLERKPKDFDIGTSATPRQIKRLFRNCRIIGRRFRLAHIYFQNGKIIEVATFRARDDVDVDSAGNVQDGDLLIREDNQFGTMEEDALRRDFTINSLFYDVNKGTVLDHADGLGDLRRRLVRTIGDPTVRFKEDPIRILRAVKFAARLDFEIEPQTLKALQRTREEIPKAAAPRILEEINRFCRGGAARRSFELLQENGVFETIAPEVAERYADEPIWKLFLTLLENFDRQSQNGTEVGTGQILSALLLPVLMDDLGWQADGSVRRPDDLDVRETVEGMLRPLALRLRIARKDQEHCRQVITCLYRMVPARSLHRNTKRSLLRRTCLPDAVAILDAVGGALGGDLGEAGPYWRKAVAGRSTDTPSPRSRGPRQAPGEESDEPKRPRRRRGSRGGRGRRGADSRGSGEKDQTTGAVAKPGPANERSKTEKKPQVWDDDYFFSALPSVPEMAGDDVKGDRYGSAEGGPTDEPREAAPDSVEESETVERPKRKRRPRRRRRPSSQSEESSPPKNPKD